MNRKIPWELIAKYLSGECSEEEIENLKQWIESSPKNKHIFNQFESVWRKYGNLHFDFKPNVEKALNKINDQLKYHQEEFIPKEKLHFTYSHFMRYSKRIAAIFIFFLGLYLLYSQLIVKDKQTLVEVIIPHEEKRSLTLDDSSKVWLNSSSRFEYPEKFQNDKREVFLEGEAFFEINQLPRKDFIINTIASVINVKGTSFNVRAKPGENNEIITVTEGEVSLSSKKLRNRQTIILEAGYEGINHKSQNLITKEKNDDLNYLAWKTGILEFNNTSLESVINVLQEIYEVSFEIGDKEILEYIFTGRFKNADLVTIIEAMALSMNLSINYSEDKCIIELSKEF